MARHLFLALALVGSTTSAGIATTGVLYDVPRPAPTAATTSTTVSPATTGESPVSDPAPGTLRSGDAGPRTLELQQRLTALGYWLGEPDGTYGDLTVQAVTALQKVHGITRDGIAGPAVTAALASPTAPPARLTYPDAAEIDKQRQVMYVVQNGAVRWIVNVSTGTDKRYRVNGRTELADTPDGEWTVSRVYDGIKRAELGRIYRPRYFHTDGIAVHGFGSVPAFPASHGCVRVSKPAMDWIWSADVMPIGSAVFVY